MAAGKQRTRTYQRARCIPSRSLQSTADGRQRQEEPGAMERGTTLLGIDYYTYRQSPKPTSDEWHPPASSRRS